MTTYTYDDGSTITYDGAGVSSTPSPDGYMLSDYGSNFTPGAVSSGAGSWLDVLKFGIGRVADYRTAVDAPQNTPARYAAPVYYGGSAGGLGLNSNMLMLFGLAAGAFLLARSLGSKKG